MENTEIAERLDRFYMDTDPYGYGDAISTAEDFHSEEYRVCECLNLLESESGLKAAINNVRDYVNDEDNEDDKNIGEYAELLNNLKSLRTPTMVVIAAGQAPIVQRALHTDLKTLQGVVDGYIEYVTFVIQGEEFIAICNEEGKLKSLPGNRRIENDIIAGTFIVCTIDEDGDIDSLTEEQVRKVMARFAKIENYQGLDTVDEIFIEVLSFKSCEGGPK